MPSGQKQTNAGNSHCTETTSRRKRPGAGKGFLKTSKTTLVFYPHTSSLQVLRSTHISLAETEQIVDCTFVSSLFLIGFVQQPLSHGLQLSNIRTGSRQAVACGKFRQHVKWFRNMLQPHQDKCAYFSCKNKAALSKKQALYTRKSELWKTDLGFCCLSMLRRTPVDARVLRDSIKEWCANELQDTSYSRSSFTRTGATKIKITEITRVTQLQAVSLAAK